VRIPGDAIIPDDKIAGNRIVQKARHNKLKILSQAEFTQENPEALRLAIQSLATADIEAIEDRSNAYGAFYQVAGKLVGVNGVIRRIRITVYDALACYLSLSLFSPLGKESFPLDRTIQLLNFFLHNGCGQGRKPILCDKSLWGERCCAT
jgi:hypothetical protein